MNHDLNQPSLSDQGPVADGRQPPRGRPSESQTSRGGILKKSTYYGILLYILSESREDLTSEQVAWIVYYSRKLNQEQLLRAGTFSSKLRTDEETLRRTQIEIKRIRSRIPSLRNFRPKEPRRIGTGYHDKGSLRPRHRPRPEGERVFWSQDFRWMTPLTEEEIEGKWITALEVRSLVGDFLFDLIVESILRNRLQS